mmetsp:Transcript_458/g.703  ORF Transcript_458/g.703 Transcript_458/m.703 type:complete len:104 (+) Transcript_458:453-764(+)
MHPAEMWRKILDSKSASIFGIGFGLAGPHDAYLTTMMELVNKEKDHDPSRETKEREALIALYRALWATHTSCIHAGLKHAKKEEALMPEMEHEFALGFATWSN